MEDLGVAFLFVLCQVAALILAVVITVETVAIKLAADVSWPRALGDSWLMNIASTVLLLVPTYVSAAFLAESYMGAVLTRNRVAISVLVIGPLLIGILLSILVEAGVLSLRKTSTPRGALRISAIANMASYFLLTLLAVFVFPRPIEF